MGAHALTKLKFCVDLAPYYAAAYRVTKSGVGPFPPGSQPRPICYAALLFLSNASSTSLSTLSSPPGSSGRGSRS